MDWKSREGRAIILLLGFLIEFLLLLILAAAIATYYEQSYGGVLLHVIIGSLAPFFAYFDGFLTASYTAIIITYQVLDNLASKRDLGAYATGFAVSSLVIVLAQYFWRAKQEAVMFRDHAH